MFCYNDNHKNVFVVGKRTWQQAKSKCESMGMNLATVNNETENNWLKTTANSITTATSGWWIGLNDLDNEGTFEWESGLSSSFVDWDNGEPNNGGGGEDCVSLLNLVVQHTDWSDYDCGMKISFICEDNDNDPKSLRDRRHPPSFPPD
jgi:C-type mannose receptor